MNHKPAVPDYNKNKKSKTNKPLKQPVVTTSTILRKAWLMAAAIVIVTYLIYTPSLQNDFVNWDDQEYVTENPMVVNTTVPVKEIFTKAISGNYHPLTMLTLCWNYQSGTLNARGYHAVNLVFHLLNTLLTFFFVFLLTRRNLLMASITAFFFGVHPMHVESVAWVSERKDVLYVFFFLAGLITYIQYRASGKLTWYFVTLFLFILSCLSKGMAVVFPVILILLDYYLDVKWNKKTIIEKIPFFILSLIFGIVTYHFQQQGLPPDIVIYNPLYKIMFACYGAVMYVVKLFIPYGLSCFYPYPSMGKVVSSMIYFPFILAAVAALVYFFLRKEKVIVFGLLFYLVSVALVLQFITIGSAIMADRYAYLSYIGLLLVAAHLVDKAWEEKNTTIAFLKTPITIFVVIAAIAFSFQSNARTKVWKNGETLWTDAISNYPQYYVSHANRGEYYQSLGEDDNALTDFDKSLQLNPAYSEAYNNRGLIYYKYGKYDSALADYGNAIIYNHDPDQSSYYYANHGLAGMKLKQNDRAEKDFEKAFELDSVAPKSNIARLLVNRGFFYDQTNQYEKAIADYTRYLQLKPEDDVLYNARGLCYVKLNKFNEAFEDFSKAAELKPAVPNYWLNRSASENTLGRKADAKADAQKAVELGIQVDPNYLKDLDSK